MKKTVRSQLLTTWSPNIQKTKHRPSQRAPLIAAFAGVALWLVVVRLVEVGVIEVGMVEG